jgi:hypothetical protein
VQQRDEDAGAGRADRVAERDGAAIDVDAGWVEPKFGDDGEALRGEGLVDLPQVDIAG